MHIINLYNHKNKNVHFLVCKVYRFFLILNDSKWSVKLDTYKIRTIKIAKNEFGE